MSAYSSGDRALSRLSRFGQVSFGNFPKEADVQTRPVPGWNGPCCTLSSCPLVHLKRCATVHETGVLQARFPAPGKLMLLVHQPASRSTWAGPVWHGGQRRGTTAVRLRRFTVGPSSTCPLPRSGSIGAGRRYEALLADAKLAELPGHSLSRLVLPASRVLHGQHRRCVPAGRPWDCVDVHVAITQLLCISCPAATQILPGSDPAPTQILPGSYRGTAQLDAKEQVEAAKKAGAADDRASA